MKTAVATKPRLQSCLPLLHGHSESLTGQMGFDHQWVRACESAEEGPVAPVTLTPRAFLGDKGGEGALNSVLSNVMPPPLPVVENIIQLCRERRVLVKSETALTLSVHGQLRWQFDLEPKQAAAFYTKVNAIHLRPNGTHDKIHWDAYTSNRALFLAKDPIHAQRLQFESQIEKAAKTLPVAAWVAEQRGFGQQNLGLIIGETGDLSLYANPGKVWKRLGLAVDEDGRAQGRRSDRDAAIRNGFSPRRRAISWMLGETLIRQNKGVYREAYERKKAEYGDACGCRNGAKACTHCHRKAKRYMEKLAIKHLWQAWRAC